MQTPRPRSRAERTPRSASLAVVGELGRELRLSDRLPDGQVLVLDAAGRWAPSTSLAAAAVGDGGAQLSALVTERDDHPPHLRVGRGNVALRSQHRKFALPRARGDAASSGSAVADCGAEAA